MKWRPGANPVICALCGTLLGSCDSPSAPDPVLWEGDLVPVETAVMSGSIAMVAGTHDTRIGIGISEGPADASLRWVVREGRCDTSGASIAPASVFPTLTTSAEGSASAETVIRRRVSSSVAYAAEVTTAANERLACAELQRIE